MVDVDPVTGRVTVVDYAIAEDLGRALNPQVVRGQLLGGRAQGIGYALFEDMVYDSNGHLVNPTFTDYKVPTIYDLPMDSKLEIIETLDPNTAYGQKGAGESGLPPVAGAIANAVADAIGVDVMELPLTPEKVWKAMQSKK